MSTNIKIKFMVLNSGYTIKLRERERGQPGGVLFVKIKKNKVSSGGVEPKGEAHIGVGTHCVVAFNMARTRDGPVKAGLKKIGDL